MRRSLMVLSMLLVSTGVANAQGGPAGPPEGPYGSGFFYATGGRVAAWAGMEQVTNVPAGTSVTLVYVPTPSAFGTIVPTWVEYKDAYSGVVLSTAGTTCTIQPGQSGTLNVIATAYGHDNLVVDKAIIPTPVTWEPPYELQFYRDAAGRPKFKVVDRFGDEMGPGAEYQIQGTWTIGDPANTGAFGGIGNAFPMTYGPGFTTPWIVPSYLYQRLPDWSSRSAVATITYRFNCPTFNGYSLLTGYTTTPPVTYVATWNPSVPPPFNEDPNIQIYGPDN